jgi:hypothetical protein
MYKTVNFNIFEENLEEIVYGKNSASRNEKNNPAEKTTAKLVRKISEIIIKPLNEKKSESEGNRT